MTAQNSSNFASKSKRDIFHLLRHSFQTPGPGSYATEITPHSIPKQKPKTFAMCIDPTPPSIPIQDLFPIGDSPPLSIKKLFKASDFSKNQIQRKVFEVTSESPGPGSYGTTEILEKTIHQPAWMFSSKSSRKDWQRYYSPGPGSYSLSPKKPSNIGIFSTAPRANIVTNDPYRPIQVGCHDVPAVGTYKTKEDIIKEKKLKAKFVTGKAQIKTVPFNICEKRELKSVNKDKIPGPGEYLLEKSCEKKEVNCLIQSPRFEKDRVIENPGPGTYDSQIIVNEKASPVFSSKTPRFSSVRSKNCTPEPYLGHEKWTKKQTRAVDSMIMNQKLCFETSEPRFNKKKNPCKIGPGSYETRPSTVIGMPLSKTTRFSGYGAFRPSTGTDQHMGPGYYNPLVTCKKSFNMAKELKDDKLWLM